MLPPEEKRYLELLELAERLRRDIEELKRRIAELEESRRKEIENLWKYPPNIMNLTGGLY